MKKLLFALMVPGVALGLAACQVSSGGNAGAAAQPGSAGTAASAVPNPAMSAPDETAWNVFIDAVKPAGGAATFQGWASDTDTFKPGAAWPSQGHTAATTTALVGAPHLLLGRPALRPKKLSGLEATGAQQGIPNPQPPTTEPGNDNNLIEEVFRNRPAFDFIVNNHLNSRSGLQAAYKAATVVSFPSDSIEVKTNWIPVADIGQYYPGATADQFYVATFQGNTQYALIAMHVISKLVPNWTWATFEHQLNPGRCDFIGCNDTYGAATPHVAPMDNQGQNQGQVYGACTKTPALEAALKAAGVAAVFSNYCLKGSQTDFTDNTGLAVRLGNTVTEYSFVPQASCMTCHGEANFTSAGKSTTGFGFIGGNGQVGPINPALFGYWKTSGAPPAYPLYQGMPGLVRNASSADFVWSIPFCAYDDVTNPSQPAPSNCAGK
jgi:hypothetical protein